MEEPLGMNRIWIGIVLALLGLAGGAYVFRKDLVLFGVATLAKRGDIAPYAPVAWQQGPPEATTRPEQLQPPNIILIVADDLGLNDISTFGGGVAGGRIKTPNIDRLAARGVNFTQGYAGHATCAPSRAMMMTGRYATRTGFESTPTPNGMGRILSLFDTSAEAGLPPVRYDHARAATAPSFERRGLPGSEVTLAEVLKDAGYHTVHIGKWHTGLGPEFGPNAQGFDESLLMANGLYLPEDHPDVVNAKLPFDPIDTFLWARMQFAAAYNEGPWFEPGGYLTDWWTDETLKVIEANKNRPFFVKLAHWGVHTPLQATRADYEAVGDLEPERLRVYAAMVRSLDRSVGRILDALEAQGLAENTVIVFTSDNGAPGYIGIDDVNAPYRGWKLTFFEGGIRVPMFVSWPARVAAGQQIAVPVSHIDLMPTLAAAAGAALPTGLELDGADLLPLASGAVSPDTRPHEALFWRSGYYRAVRSGDWKLQVTDHPARNWLFDLATDPTEARDLSASHPEKVAELTALMDAHFATARPQLFPASVEGAVAIDFNSAERAPEGAEYVYWPN
jgi:uncharacterized sulfatase